MYILKLLRTWLHISKQNIDIHIWLEEGNFKSTKRMPNHRPHSEWKESCRSVHHILCVFESLMKLAFLSKPDNSNCSSYLILKSFMFSSFFPITLLWIITIEIYVLMWGWLLITANLISGQCLSILLRCWHSSILFIFILLCFI